MNKYKFKELQEDRWVIWYKELENQGNRIGVYKIFDAYKNGRKNARFAVRYKPRKGQTQTESDNLILAKTIRDFYKQKPIFFSKRGDTRSI